MAGRDEEYRPEFHGGRDDSRLLGDGRFVDQCLAGPKDMPPRLTLQAIVDGVCREYKLDVTVLRMMSQQRVASESRAVIGWLAGESGCATLSAVGKRVNPDVGSISSSVRRLSYRMRDDPKLADRVRSLRQELEKRLDNLEA